MADLGTIGIAIEVRGREALRQIENDMTAVDRSAKSAARSFEVFERAGLKKAETFRYVSDAAKKRLSDEERITKEIVKQRDAAEQLARANAQAFQSQIGSNLGLGARGISASASASAIESEIERLRQKYDQVYAASQLYESSLKELNQAHMLGITSIKQHEAAVEALNAEYQAFQNGSVAFGNRFADQAGAMQQSTSGLARYGVVMQQTGYQVGDFLVQVQSGTNAFVAFGQQATQLAGLLTMSMNPQIVALGAALSIVIPLVTAIAAAFKRTSEDSQKATQAIDEQKAAYDRLVESVRQLRLENEMARTGAASTEEQEALNQLERLEANRIVLMLQRDEVQRQINENLETSRQGEIDILNAQIAQNEADQEKFRTLIRINKEQEAEKTARELAKKAASEMQKVMNQISNMDLSGPWSSVVGFIQAAINKAGEFARSSMVYSGRGGDPRLFGANAGQSNTFNVENFAVPDVGTGGGGGGGGNIRLDSLINQLQTEREVLEDWYTESQETLMSASESELAIIGGYNEAKLRLEQEYQDRLKNIRDESNNTALTDAANFFGGLAAVTENGGERLVKATQTFAAIEALINTYRAQAQVLADPTLGFFGKAAAYLQIGAAGLNVVRAIKGVSGGGSGSAGSARGSATVAPTASAPIPQTVMIDSIDPDSLYSGQTLINLFDAFYDENDKRGKVFLVAR